jgi:hypothetical protein
MKNIKKFKEFSLNESFIKEGLTTFNFPISLGWAIKNQFIEQLHMLAARCGVNINVNKISGHITVKYNVNVIGEEKNIKSFISNVKSHFSKSTGEEEWDNSTLGTEPTGEEEWDNSLLGPEPTGEEEWDNSLLF